MRSFLAANRSVKWPLVVLVFAFLSQTWLSAKLDHWVHPEPFESSQSGTLDPRIVSSLRAAAFLTGYKVLIGHVFWIKVIQYYGDGQSVRSYGPALLLREKPRR